MQKASAEPAFSVGDRVFVVEYGYGRNPHHVKSWGCTVCEVLRSQTTDMIYYKVAFDGHKQHPRLLSERELYATFADAQSMADELNGVR